MHRKAHTMSNMSQAVVLDGQQIAQFQSTSQADWWIEKIAEAASVARDRYKIVPVSGDDEVQAYKDRVYSAAMEAASDPTCSAVQAFLDDIGIDRERYAVTQTFTVDVKYDENVQGSVDPYDVERAIEDGAAFEHHGIEVSRA